MFGVFHPHLPRHHVFVCLGSYVDVAELLGAETNVYATIGNDAIIASVPARADLEKGSAVKLAFDMNHCHVFDAETELVLF